MPDKHRSLEHTRHSMDFEFEKMPFRQNEEPICGFLHHHNISVVMSVVMLTLLVTATTYAAGPALTPINPATSPGTPGVLDAPVFSSEIIGMMEPRVDLGDGCVNWLQVATSGRYSPGRNFLHAMLLDGAILRGSNIFKGQPVPDKIRIEGQENEISVTERGFASYVYRLELNFQQMMSLKGKRILDIGAGRSDFVDVANSSFGTKAVAVDPLYATYPIDGFDLKKLKIYKKTRLPMDARKLGFPDKSIDLIVSNTMLNWFFFGSHSPTKLRIDNGIQILEELIRVTKPGGEIRTTDLPNPHPPKGLEVFASQGEPWEYYQKQMDELLKKHHQKVTIEYPLSKEATLTRIKILN